MNEYIEFKEEYPFIEWNNQFLMEYSIFCESDDNLTDDIEESAPGPYEQWLKLHDYDPKTNTIAGKRRVTMGDDYDKYMSMINDKTYDPINHTVNNRINVGKIGSNKERNRLNQFLKKNDFDPKTGTYRSDIRLPDGSYARIPLHVGADKTGTIDGAFARHQTNVFSPKKKLERKEKSLRHNEYELGKLNEELMDASDDDEKREIESEIQYVKNAIKRARKGITPDEKNQIYKDHLNTLSTHIPKRDLMKARASSTMTNKHEEGHHDVELNIGHDTMDPHDTQKANIKFPNYDTRASMMAELKHHPDNDSISVGSALNSHDKSHEERYADTYSVRHNPYVKSKDRAVRTLVGSLDRSTLDEHKRIKRQYDGAIKFLNYYKNNYNEIKNNPNFDKDARDRKLKKVSNNFSDDLAKEFLSGKAPLKTVDNAIKAFEKAKQASLIDMKEGIQSNHARGELLRSQLSDEDFKRGGDPALNPKTNAERSQERKERGELPRKQKKQAKKQNVVKEYMI